MGVRILEGDKGRMACFYCSTSDWAFGPVFLDYENQLAGDLAEGFFNWHKEKYGTDLRLVKDSDLESRYGEWIILTQSKEKRDAK